MTQFDRSMLSRSNKLWLLTLTLTAVAGLVVTPGESRAPIHWNLQGEADVFAPGRVAVLLPLIFGLAILGVMLLIRRAGSAQAAEAARHPYHVTQSAVLAFFVFFEGAMIYVAQGGQLDMQSLMIAAAGILLIVVGNSLPKTRPSWQAGLPLRWLHGDPDRWRVTQRWFARLHIICGLALVALAFTSVKGPLLIVLILALALLPTIVATLMALRIGGKAPPV